MKTPLSRPSTPAAMRLARIVAGNERRRRRSFWQFYRTESMQEARTLPTERMTEASLR